MNQFLGIDHASLLVLDLEKSLYFYCEILGIKQDLKRPRMNFEGAWLNIDKQQIHLINCPNPDPIEGRPEHGGRDRHIALKCSNLNTIKEKLVQNNLTYTLSKSGRKALFCRDPDGNTIEIIQA